MPRRRRACARSTSVRGQGRVLQWPSGSRGRRSACSVRTHGGDERGTFGSGSGVRSGRAGGGRSRKASGTELEITLASEGRLSAMVSSAGSGGASMPSRSTGATNSRIPMTDAMDWRVVCRAARPSTTLRSWPIGIPVRVAKGLSPSALPSRSADEPALQRHLLREVSSAPVRISRRNAVAGSVRGSTAEIDAAEPSTGPDERRDIPPRPLTLGLVAPFDCPARHGPAKTGRTHRPPPNRGYRARSEVPPAGRAARPSPFFDTISWPPPAVGFGQGDRGCQPHPNSTTCACRRFVTLSAILAPASLVAKSAVTLILAAFLILTPA